MNCRLLIHSAAFSFGKLRALRRRILSNVEVKLHSLGWRKIMPVSVSILSELRSSGRSFEVLIFNYRVVLFFCAVIFALAGCATMPNLDKGMENSALLEPQALLKFSDVPIPTGFKLLPQESYTFESSGVRVGVLKYKGKAAPDRVVSFYKEQMPMYNWALLNVVEYGDRLMNFDRENETCIIGLLVKGSVVTITISLGPKSRIPKKPDRAVK